MINIESAISIAENKLHEMEKGSGVELVILKKNTIEFEYGWLFFYQSKEFVETADLNLLLGGNSPIIVDKYNSSVHFTGTRMEADFYIEKYCQYRDNIDVFHKEIR